LPRRISSRCRPVHILPSERHSFTTVAIVRIRGPPAAQPVDTSAGLEALRALDLAARSAPPPDANPGLRADERAASRDRAPLAFALEHAAQSSSNDVARQQTTAPRGLELAAPAVAAPGEAPAAAAKTARLDEPAPLTLATTPAAGDAAAAGATGFAPLAAQHGSGSAAPAGATAQPAGQLPPHLQTPVDAQAARWHDALASRIQWLVDHDVGEAQIKLNPPELGAIDVKVSMLDDKTFVQMTAQSAAARDELSHSLPRLRELLSAGGLDLGGATVSGGRDERGAYQAAPAPVSRAASFAAAASEAIDAVPRARLSSAARIDTFA